MVIGWMTVGTFRYAVVAKDDHTFTVPPRREPGYSKLMKK
jgi:hypothetical protein